MKIICNPSLKKKKKETKKKNEAKQNERKKPATVSISEWSKKLAENESKTHNITP